MISEDEAREWLVKHLNVSRETLEKLDAFAAAVEAESANQNLISASTIPQIWGRHIVDSAQLVTLSRDCPGTPDGWLDLGTGAGFPGVVVAIILGTPITLVESRRKRADFLAAQVESLGLTHATAFAGRLETLPTRQFGIISARAFAPLPKLFQLAHRFAHKKTLWLLPKGKSGPEELESTRASWQGAFHVKQSVTDADAAIIVATGVNPRKIAR